ncbi:hypothetical protein D3C71_1245640 [compost metagenome]
MCSGRNDRMGRCACAVASSLLADDESNEPLLSPRPADPRPVGRPAAACGRGRDRPRRRRTLPDRPCRRARPGPPAGGADPAGQQLWQRRLEKHAGLDGGAGPHPAGRPPGAHAVRTGQQRCLAGRQLRTGGLLPEHRHPRFPAGSGQWLPLQRHDHHRRTAAGAGERAAGGDPQGRGRPGRRGDGTGRHHQLRGQAAGRGAHAHPGHRLGRLALCRGGFRPLADPAPGRAPQCGVGRQPDLHRTRRGPAQLLRAGHGLVDQRSRPAGGGCQLPDQFAALGLRLPAAGRQHAAARGGSRAHAGLPAVAAPGRHRQHQHHRAAHLPDQHALAVARVGRLQPLGDR